MRTLSLLARQWPVRARILIIVSFLLLTCSGVTVGVLLDSMGFSIPAISISICLGIYFFTILLYPSRPGHAHWSTKWNYKNRKRGDAILATLTFLLVICISNNRFEHIGNFSPASAAISSTSITPSDSATKTYKTIAAFTASMKDANGTTLKWKERRKLLKEQVRAIRHSSLSRSGKAGLIILSVVVAIGLLFLVTALACNLSCNGSETAAIALGIGGIALVVFLLIVTLKAINKKQKRKAWEKGDGTG